MYRFILHSNRKKAFFQCTSFKLVNIIAELTPRWCQTHISLRTNQCQGKADRSHVGDDDRTHVYVIQNDSAINSTPINWNKCNRDVKLGWDFQVWNALRPFVLQMIRLLWTCRLWWSLHIRQQSSVLLRRPCWRHKCCGSTPKQWNWLEGCWAATHVSRETNNWIDCVSARKENTHSLKKKKYWRTSGLFLLWKKQPVWQWGFFAHL